MVIPDLDEEGGGDSDHRSKDSGYLPFIYFSDTFMFMLQLLTRQEMSIVRFPH